MEAKKEKDSASQKENLKKLEANIRAIDQLASAGLEAGFKVDNPNDDVLRDIIERKLLEMFGTGRNVAEAKQVIMQHLHEAVKKFNKEIAQSFEEMMSNDRKTILGGMKEKVQAQFADIKKEVLIEMDKQRTEFIEELDKRRGEFLEELKKL